MQYILPLVVNDRRSHFLSLKHQLLGCENFIAVHQNGITSIPLFKFNKSKKIQTLKQGTSDISLGDVKIIVVPDCPEYEFEIKISSALVTPQSKSDLSFFPGSKTDNKKTTREKTETHKCKNNTLSIETTETETEFTVNFLTQPRLNDGQNLRIKFSYADGAEVFASAIEVILAPDANFVHAGLDFGSEASQLKYAKWARRTLKIEDFALFESLKLSENENGDNSAYVQYEKNTDFLKSVFFCKKKLSDFDEDLPSSVLNDLKLITRQDAINNGGYKDYYQLPNLKIAHKYADSFKELSFSVPTSKGIRIKKMNDMKEVLYPAILQKIIESFLMQQIEKNECYLRFTILVPNIYGIDDIIETKKVISDIVNELNSSKLNDLIKGLEVITLSESDASFLGYYNTTGGNSTIPNAFYLTIDCGKGTTDYSILKTGQRNVREIIPVYRNGFAGAGNLITSAFFHSIFSFIIENADNKAAALKELTQTFDASNIGSITFKLFNIVERLKINYSNQKSGIKKEEIEAEWNRIKNRDFTLKNYFDKGAKTIDTLFDILNDCANCYDWNGYINHAVDIICNNIVMNLKEVVKNLDPAVKCGGVLLTGRAFLFKPLLNKLKSQLETIPQLRAVEIKSPTDSVTLKNVCMLGLFRDNFVVDTDLPGWPIPVFVVDETKTTKSNNGSTWDLWTKVVDAFNKEEMTNAMEENSYELNIANFNDVKFMMGGEFYEASATGFYQIAESEVKPDFIFAKDGFVLRRFDSERRFIRSSNLITTASTDLRDIVNKSVKPSLFPAQIETEFMKAYAVLAPAVASVVEKPPYDPLAGLRPHKKYETPN